MDFMLILLPYSDSEFLGGVGKKEREIGSNLEFSADRFQ